MEKKLLNPPHTLEERIDLILREYVNSSESVENFIELATKRLTELIMEERVYGKK
jgi:hypothetical protein